MDSRGGAVAKFGNNWPPTPTDSSHVDFARVDKAGSVEKYGILHIPGSSFNLPGLFPIGKVLLAAVASAAFNGDSGGQKFAALGQWLSGGRLLCDDASWTTET